MKQKINIKPLSVNKCWQGRRYKTPEYENYETELLLLLKNLDIPHPPHKINIQVGFSSKNADIDNVLKPFLDILQKKYKFNDRHIYILNAEKIDVKKGNEFIDFEIKHLDLFF